MSTKAKRHTHKYHHVDLDFGKVWACALPNCNHYMPLHMNNLVPGKNSICWGCGESFILDSINMKNDKPVCNECKSTSEPDLTDFITSLEK